MLPIILLAIPLDYFISANLIKLKNTQTADHLGEEFYTWNKIYSGKMNIDIAIYGSSRAADHINPKILEDSLQKMVYNFGMRGHTFWMQNYKHKEFIKYNKVPNYIIYDIDMFTLDTVTVLSAIEQFFPYMLFNESMQPYIEKYNVFSKCYYYIPLIRYFGQYKAILLAIKGCLSINDSKWEKMKNLINRDKTLVNGEATAKKDNQFGENRVWNDDFDKAKQKMKYRVIQLDTTLVRMFENFISECQNKNIKIIFVYDPEYIEGQMFIKGRESVFNLYMRFSDKYDIPFLNYSNDSICYQRKYFYNSEHMNSDGADLYTKKLAHDLKKLKIAASSK